MKEYQSWLEQVEEGQESLKDSKAPEYDPVPDNPPGLWQRKDGKDASVANSDAGQDGKDWVTRISRKEHEKVTVKPWPKCQDLDVWRSNVVQAVCVASGDPDTAAWRRWLSPALLPSPDYAELADSGEFRFQSIDSKLSIALQNMVDSAGETASEVKVRIRQRSQVLGKEGNFLMGREILAMVLDHFRTTSKDEVLFNASHIYKLQYRGDKEMDKFHAWIEIIANMKAEDIPSDNTLRDHLLRKIDGSQALHVDLTIFKGKDNDDKKKSYSELLEIMRRHIARAREDRNIAARDKFATDYTNLGKPSTPAPKPTAPTPKPRKKGGYVIGRLVTFDKNCAWVQLGTQTVRVDRNQLRPAYGFEAWSPSHEDVQALKDAEKNFLDGEVYNLTGPPPPEDEPLEPEILVPPTPGAPGTPATAVPSTPVLGEAFQRPASPRTRQIKRSTEQPRSSASSQKRPATEDELEGQKLANLICSHDELGLTHEIELRPPGWDGSDWDPDPAERLVNLPEVFASEHGAPAMPCDVEELGVEDSHSSWHVCYLGDQKALVNAEKLTRKELKALNREIPWREIVRQGGIIIFKKYVESARKEHEQWQTWASVKPLPDHETKKVLADPVLRTRVLRSRACYRDKNLGQGELRAKCRVVVLGHKDPDLGSISRDSPTPTRLTEHLLLTVYISGKNRLFLNGKSWRLWAADATTAFLQGTQSDQERPNRLFMQPPRDPILSAAGAFPASLYEVHGNVYGLSNAPRLWSLEVGKRLVNAGFRPHSMDRMCFLHYGEGDNLDCMALVYVDDFLVTYNDQFNLDTITSLFKWGSTTSDDEIITFKGKQLQTVKRDGQDILLVRQTEYIKSLSPQARSPARDPEAKNSSPRKT